MKVVAGHNPGNEAEFDLVHADLLRFFPDLVRELGGDPDALLRRFGTDPGSTDVASLSYRSWVNLLEHAAAELECLDFGLRLARLQGGRTGFGPISLVMKNSRTFGEAIDYAAKHLHAHSLAAGMRLVRDGMHGRLFVSHEILLDSLPNKRQAIEQVMLLGHLLALESTGGRARAREVHFRHQPLSSRWIYRTCFGCTVRFEEQEDGLVFEERDLRSPIVDRDAQLYEAATSFIDNQFGRVTPPLHAQVRALIVRLLESSDCSIERVCEELGTHPRTLHRRLKAEGSSFEGIKDAVRRDIALRYLEETDHPLTFIAEKLGYAEQSVLTRSCVRWFSAPPSEVRERAAH